MTSMEEQLRNEIKTIHNRLHGRQRTHQEVAKHSRWTGAELDNVLREDEWLYEKEMLDLLSQHTQKVRETINRFEVINHLSDGSGREVIVWKGEPFTAEFSLQDDGRTLKVFLTDIAQLSTKDSTNKEDV